MRLLSACALSACVTLGCLVACADGQPSRSDREEQAGGQHQASAGQSHGGASSPGGRPPVGAAGEALAGESAGGAGADVTFVVPRGPCAPERRVGRFNVEAQKDFGVVQGSLLEGAVPTSIPELTAEEGPCKLLKRRNLACSPACVGAETCGEEGTCIPYPRQVDVGAVTVAGLTKVTRMTPQKPGAVYFATGADNPPFTPGSQVILSAEGSGMRAGFHLFGVGSSALKVPPSWRLERGKDLALDWEAPKEQVDTQVLVELTIDQHGVSPLSLSCELPDTGEGVVPAQLVERMIESGVSGFPNGRIVRRTIDNVELDVGCVELSVGSALSASVRVSGFTPCNASTECPSGQTCNLQQELCE